MNAVITVLGKDNVGILAKVASECAEVGVNITEVTQSVLQGMFAMIMFVDISGCTVPFSQLVDALTAKGEEMGVKVHVMHEDIFNAMRKIQALKRIKGREKIMIHSHDILETINMIDHENLDVRTITMGISLLDCIDDDINKACRKVYDKICRYAENLVKTGEDISKEYGIPIIHKRIAVTPVAMLAAACPTMNPVKFAKTLDKAADTVGVNFVGGYSALVHKGFAPGDYVLI